VIPGVVLAAGRSSRMGRPKANLPLDDRDTFLTRIVRTFIDAGVPDVVVVVGHDRDAIRTSFDERGLRARFVENANYDRGQLSSLQAGLLAVDRPGVTAALVTLVDVPFFSQTTVRAVVDRFRDTGAPIVRPTSGARHGHPLLIDRSLFVEFYRGDDASGAKPIVRGHASPAGDVRVDDEGAFTDIDTAEEYGRVLSDRLSGGGDADRARRVERS
jgi:molybdenum cofactor cytidylyltransferase